MKIALQYFFPLLNSTSHSSENILNVLKATLIVKGIDAPYSKTAEETDYHCYQPSHKMLNLPVGKIVKSCLSICPSYPFFIFP